MTDFTYWHRSRRAAASEQGMRVWGIPIHESWEVPRDKIVLVNGTVSLHPSSVMAIKFGRTPLWTRHMSGVIEAERDQRRRQKRR